MKIMKYGQDGEVFDELNKVLKAKDEMVKTAQALPPPGPAPGTVVPAAAPVPAGPKPEMWKKLDEQLEASRGNAKALEGMQMRLQTLNYPQGEQGYYDELMGKLQKYMSPEVMLTDARTKHKMAPMQKRQSATEQTAKVASGKEYDVGPKEDLVQKAHPHSAKVEGDTVENLNEQQKADLAVANKQAAAKVLTALYDLTKKLYAEKNVKAAELVKETFLSISKNIKA